VQNAKIESVIGIIYISLKKKSIWKITICLTWLRDKKRDKKNIMSPISLYFSHHVEASLIRSTYLRPTLDIIGRKTKTLTHLRIAACIFPGEHYEFHTSRTRNIEYYFHEYYFQRTWPRKIIPISPSLSEQRNPVAAVSRHNYFCQTWFDEADLCVVSAGKNTSSSSPSSPLDKSILGFVLPRVSVFHSRIILRSFKHSK